MLRAFACSVAVGAFVLLAQASGQQTQNQQQRADQGVGTNKEHVTKATVVSIDPDKNTITLKMKDKNGKQVERTVELKGGVKVFNDKGEATRVEVFRRGNTMYVVERQERVYELRTTPEHRGGTNADQKSGTSNEKR